MSGIPRQPSSSAPGGQNGPVTAMDVKPFPPKIDQQTGFVIGGRNSTKLIRSLASINGISIADLERQMRPGAEGKEGSTAGFLGKSESLLTVLAQDNAYVVDQLELTHQGLARPMLAIANYARENNTSRVTWRGILFYVEIEETLGYQYSPFRDGTKTSADVTIRNLRKGTTLTYSLLVPQMIERYGFYEGQGTKYRVEPRKIVEVFELMKR